MSIDSYILVTGGFDPLHSGHISMFLDAMKYGKVVVGINSDASVRSKKGAVLLPFEERRLVVDTNKYIFSTLQEENDLYNSYNLIYQFYRKYSGKNITLYFGNGGDRTESTKNKAESDLCNSLGITQVFNLGGSKTASSSEFLNEYVQNMRGRISQKAVWFRL